MATSTVASVFTNSGFNNQCQWDNSLTTNPYIASISVAAYTDCNNQTSTLTLGATSNIVVEALSAVKLFSSTGIQLYDTTMTNGTTRTDDLLLNTYLADDLATTFDATGSHNVNFTFSNQFKMNNLYITSGNSSSVDVIGTTKPNLQIANTTTFSSNVAILGNSVTYGSVFGQNFNLWADKAGAVNNADIEKVGFGFRINSNDQLELVKMNYFKDATTTNKRIAVFGMQDLPYGAEHSDSTSNYLVFNALSSNAVSTYGGNGNLISSATPLDSYITMNGANIGMGTSSAQYKLDVHGTGNFTGMLRATGGFTFGESLIPSVDQSADIGAADKRMRTVYSSSNIILGSSLNASSVHLTPINNGAALSILNASGTALPLYSGGAILSANLDMTNHSIVNVNDLITTTATIDTLTVQTHIVTPGADYAEYVTKADASITYMPGDVVGINADGKLTNVFADAHHFAVVSTHPSIIGGYLPDQFNDDDLEFAASNEKIAFCGRVPVKCPTAPVGSYIVPIADATGLVSCMAISPDIITLPQYMSAVGHVISISSNDATTDIDVPTSVSWPTIVIKQ